MRLRSTPTMMPPHEASPIAAALVGLSLAAIALLVHTTGGTHTAAPQLMYIPITVAAWCFGVRGGFLAGAAAGLLVGPLMPLDVALGTSQDPLNWIIRLGIFALLGSALGLGSNSRLNQLADLRRLNEESIRAFVHTIDAKSKHTAEHSENVAVYACRIGSELGLSPERLDRLRWESLLHDIGKLTIPDETLNKPGRLNAQEWALIERHPVESVRMLQGVQHYQPYLKAIRHHHERFDGAGYPDRLEGRAIPFHARILAVADAYDAMTSTRPYRSAFSHEAALQEILEGAGTQFDPRIVQAFARAMRTAPSRTADGAQALLTNTWTSLYKESAPGTGMPGARRGGGPVYAGSPETLENGEP